MVKQFDPNRIKQLYKPLKDSHKGQNGRLMIVGGSKLFHGASLWALKVASRIVDMVFYASVAENVELTQKLKSELYDFIAVSKDHIEEYIQDADAVLIGPGLPREEGRGTDEEKTRDLVKWLLSTYPQKRWIIDAGALTEMDPDWLLQLKGNVIITPHPKEFEKLFKNVILGSEATPESVQKVQDVDSGSSTRMTSKMVQVAAKKYNCVILLKGERDIVCNPQECIEVKGGNAGMTKGGTGDVLAGLVAALACKNDLFLAASSSSYINKKAGENLFNKVGYYFNATDLADEIPKVMKDLLL